MLILQAACALIPSMLYVHKESSIPIDIEALLITLLNHTTRIENDESTDWDQLGNHLKSLSDCIRVIAIPLPPNILDSYLALLQRVLGTVSACLEIPQGEEGENDAEEREAWEWTALLNRVEEGLGLVIELERQKGTEERTEGMQERWKGIAEGLQTLKGILAKMA